MLMSVSAVTSISLGGVPVGYLCFVVCPRDPLFAFVTEPWPTVSRLCWEDTLATVTPACVPLQSLVFQLCQGDCLVSTAWVWLPADRVVCTTRP